MNRNPTIAVKYGLSLLMIAIVARGAYSMYVVRAERDRVRVAMTKVEDKSPIVVVHIAGSVREPGVYTFSSDARLHEAVKAAGGFLPGAETGRLNLARRLNDGEKIVIKPDVVVETVAEPEGAASGVTASREARGPKPAPKGPVNINTASASQLQTIPGVGPSTAQKIIELRNSRGPFATIDEIKLVKGIGDGKFEKMKAFIVVQ